MRPGEFFLGLLWCQRPGVLHLRNPFSAYLKDGFFAPRDFHNSGVGWISFTRFAAIYRGARLARLRHGRAQPHSAVNDVYGGLARFRANREYSADILDSHGSHFHSKWAFGIERDL